MRKGAAIVAAATILLPAASATDPSALRQGPASRVVLEGPPVAARQRVYTEQGVLQLVDLRAHTINVRVGETTNTYHYTEKTLFRGPRGELTVEDLRTAQGKRVRISWFQEARRKVALSLTLLE